MSGARTADRPMRFSARPERVERAGAAVRVEFDDAHRPGQISDTAVSSPDRSASHDRRHTDMR